ncbi:hypothetical protein MAR_007012 [Mya arenaria]|uniref:Uncharacterized protein n=1 Tax=Mya arenaria TaxID=6604 RepID=A0ABY7DBX2_MYAAR|nr:hypothetical protein MAR_007012 [Mya arenaria]
MKVQNELASVRDDLVHQIEVIHEEQEILFEHLLGIMGEQSNNSQDSSDQQASSWLEREMAPELSFGKQSMKP